MCAPAFLYPQARISEEPSAMPIPDNAKGFPVVEDAYLKQARLQLMIGLMNQTMGTQANPFRQRFGNFPNNNTPLRDNLAQGQDPQLGGGPNDQGQAQGP